MAKNMSPRGRLQKREQVDLDLFSGVVSIESKHKVGTAPGQHAGRRSKLSDYGKQLRAKQMVKRIYGVLERQFRNYFKEAFRQKGSTGENLLKLLEARLDNIVYRSGFAVTRREARQMVNHKFFTVNGQVVNIPSYLMKAGDVLAVREEVKSKGRVSEAVALAKQKQSSDWISVDFGELKATLKALPERSDLSSDINEQLIVELYSK